QVEAFVEQVELAVGDDDRDLDQDVLRRVQSGHLAVHPYERLVGVHLTSLARRIEPNVRVEPNKSACRDHCPCLPLSPPRGAASSSRSFPRPAEGPRWPTAPRARPPSSVRPLWSEWSDTTTPS